MNRGALPQCMKRLRQQRRLGFPLWVHFPAPEEAHFDAKTMRCLSGSTLQPQSHAVFPQDKQLGVPSRDAPQAMHRRTLSAFEPLVPIRTARSSSASPAPPDS